MGFFKSAFAIVSTLYNNINFPVPILMFPDGWKIIEHMWLIDKIC